MVQLTEMCVYPQIQMRGLQINWHDIKMTQCIQYDTHIQLF